MVQYLDPEIAGEGEHAEHQAIIPRPHIPNYDAFKEHPHYGKYFQSRKYEAFPAFIYHATQGSRLVRDANEAAKFGVSWNKPESRWDCTGEWKNRPHVAEDRVPAAGVGKTVVSIRAGQEPSAADVIAAFMKQMADRGQTTPLAAPTIAADPDYQEFLAFKKFREESAKAREATEPAPDSESDPVELSEQETKALLVEAAASRGVKIDKRWSIDRIKEELDKAA